MKNRKILSISDVITNSSSEVFLIDAKNISKNKITKEKVINFISELIADIRSREECVSWEHAKEEAKKYDIFISEDWNSMYQLFLNCYISPDKRDTFTEEDFLKFFPYFYSVDEARKRIMSVKISDGIAEYLRSSMSSITLDEKTYITIYSLLYPEEYSYKMSNKIDNYKDEV